MRNSRVLKAEARIAVQIFKDLDRTVGGRVSEACIAGFHPAGRAMLLSSAGKRSSVVLWRSRSRMKPSNPCSRPPVVARTDRNQRECEAVAGEINRLLPAHCENPDPERPASVFRPDADLDGPCRNQYLKIIATG